MHIQTTGLTAEEWLTTYADRPPVEVAKATCDSRAWRVRIAGAGMFAKWYPTPLVETRARIETAVSAGGLHPAIVPLRHRIDAADGALLLFDRVAGENIGEPPGRGRFARLPLERRAAATLTVIEALVAVCDAGYTVVDWYEGNMLYDFDAHRLWLFDWELCREGRSFPLDMDSNYGSSRLMAPEEFVRGSCIDQGTLVFNLGRYVLLTLPELAEPLADVVARATHPARARRYASAGALLNDLRLVLADGR